MSKNFKIRNDNGKKTKRSFSEKQKWIAGVSGFVVCALLCSLLVSGLGTWVDNAYSKVPVSTSTPEVDDTAKIDFEDENLKASIIKKQNIKTSYITEKQALSITSLSIDDVEEIKSFKGLEHFASLKTLTVEKAKILDISALADAKTLTKINFKSCNLSEASSEKENEYVTSIYFLDTVPAGSAVEKFTALKSIELENATLENLECLKGFNTITTLKLNGVKKLVSFEGIENAKELTSLEITKAENLTFKGINAADKLESIDVYESTVSDASDIADNRTVKSFIAGYSKILKGVEAIGKMQELKELDLENFEFYEKDANDDEKLFDASILKNLTKLESLILNNIQLKNTDTLKDLVNIKTFEARGTGLSNISFMAGYVNVESIDLSNNSIEDISVMKNMKSLSTLDLGKNNIKSLAALENIRSLTSITVSKNENITTLSALKNNWGLTRIYATDCGIKDIGIGDCTSLTTLELTNNKIEDITVLQTLTKLKTLKLGKNSLKEIPKLTALTVIDNLSLSGNQIENIENLAEMTKLTSLDISDNKITSISALEKMTSLVTLYMEKNQISDIKPLKNLTKITSLDISDNKIEDISVIENMDEMRTLDISNNQIENITYVAKLADLRVLYIGNNKVTNINSLVTLSKLETLEAVGNSISELPELKCKKTISKLDLSNNNITDIKNLDGCTSLTNLNVANNKIKDISVISSCKMLKTIDVSGNSIIDYSPLDAFKDADIKK